MSYDHQLIDTLKTRFAGKSSAQLREIAQTTSHERWSPEAKVAAKDVLQDRKAGRAQEPDAPEEEPPPPPEHPDAYSLAFLALGLLGGLSGHLHFHVHRVNYAGEPDPDLPVPFGPNMAWLALDTTDTEAVAIVLGLRGEQPATWADGINAACQSAIFVSPPLGDWTLVASDSLFPTDRADVFVKPLLERLSRRFGEAQYFCSHRDVGLHVWARARKGLLVRGYGWLGEKGLTLWDEGAPTREECDLGFRSPADATGPCPDEKDVMALASLWSIDPTTLDERHKEPSMGLVGTIAWSEV